MCNCNKPPFYYLDYNSIYLGTDDNYADITIDTCKNCGKKWLKYLIEEEHYTKSGRWWRAPIDSSIVNILTAENSKELIESLDWCFVGGSYYDGNIHKEERPIKVI